MDKEFEFDSEQASEDKEMKKALDNFMNTPDEIKGEDGKVEDFETIMNKLLNIFKTE